MSDKSESVSLNYPGGSATFPILPSTDGASSIDFSTLTKQTGYTALDPGFVNTASTTSNITFIENSIVIITMTREAIAVTFTHLVRILFRTDKRVRIRALVVLHQCHVIVCDARLHARQLKAVVKHVQRAVVAEACS